MNEQNTTRPKVFISYSWSPEANKQTVLALATRLMEDGVHVVIDEWDLHEGQDKYVFMEQMVQNPEIKRVLMCCNKEYAEKANKRKGGAGVEGTIISSEIYDNTAQTKFIPIVLERDAVGKEYLPTFLKTRIYIDLCNSTTYEDEYDKLLRNIYEKPKSQRPPIGNMPAYLADEEVIYLPTVNKLTRLSHFIEQGNVLAYKEIKEYFKAFFNALDEYKIADPNQHRATFIQDVERNINKMLPLRANFIKFLETICDTNYLTKDILVEFWQDLINWYHRNKIELAEGASLDCLVNDHYRHFNKVLFIEIISFLLHNEQFAIIQSLLEASFVVPADNSYGLTSVYSFLDLRTYNQTLNEHKKQRDNLNYYNVEGYVIKQTTGTNFDDLVRTDIILYYLSLIYPHKSFGIDYWFPTLGVYNRNMDIMPMLISKRYFEKVKILFKVDTPEEFKSLISGITEPDLRRYEQGIRIPIISKGLMIDRVAMI